MSNFITKEIVVKRFNECHYNKYDYSLMDYKRSDEKIIVICPKHGEFKIIPNHHWRGIGCKKCGIESKIEKTTKSKTCFIFDAKKIHGDLYDYSKTIYKHSEDYVLITCKIHGDFEILACNHLQGYGCPKCLKESKIPKIFNTFKENAENIHNFKYDYSESIYNNSYEKIKIKCLIHGIFEQTPANHLKGEGCPKCSCFGISKNENEIFNFLDKLNFNLIKNNRQILGNGLELDIFIPFKNLAIEFNGLYWHNELNKDKKYHLEKTIACENKDIQLIHIFEDEWIEKQEIVKSRLINILGLNEQKIYARKCIVDEINIDEAKEFLIKNHIQGFVSGKYYYGLFYNKELVSLMSFGNLRKNLGQEAKDGEYELLRFCNKLNTSVIGGASKLFKHFLKKINPSKIISYADRRWSKGNLYETLGFNFLRDSEINYFYVIGQTRKNRFNFRKDILISKYNCSQEDTEHNFCFNKKWYRIYDCGTKVYEYNNLK